MSDQTLFLAVFVGSRDHARTKAWMALPDSERRAQERKGLAAWHAWVEKHQAAILDLGGPLGKTKAISEGGIADSANALSGFTIVRAASHEAAAKMFESHPHFAIFPGDAVEVMPVLPIPGAPAAA